MEELEWRHPSCQARTPVAGRLGTAQHGRGGSSVEWWPGQGRVGSVTHARVCGDGRGPSSDPSTQHASQLLVCREDRKWPSGT